MEINIPGVTFTNEDENTIICRLENRWGDKHYGKAKCLPEDTFNENCGQRIAFFKAYTKSLRHLCNSTVLQVYKELKDLCNIFEQCPDKYPKDDPAVKLVKRRCYAIEAELEGLRDEIKELEDQTIITDVIYNQTMRYANK